MPYSPLHPILALAVVAASPVFSTTVLAQPRDTASFVLLDPTLHETVIDLVGIRGDELVYRDDAGRVQTVKLSSTAALLPAWWSPRTKPADSFAAAVAPIKKAQTSFGLIELVDGQRLGVRLSPDPGADPETIFWESSLFGRLAIKLDTVRRVRIASQHASGASTDAAAPGATPAKQDVVVLLNGDRLSGFVERIGPVIAIESGGQLVETPSKQVAEVRLVNPARPPRGSRLWLTDGTVVDVARFLADSGPPPAGNAPMSSVKVELRTDSWARAARPTTPAPSTVAPSGSTGAETDPSPAPPAASVKPKPAPAKPGPAEPPVGTVKLAQLGALAPNVQTLVSLASRPILRQQAGAGRAPIPESEPVRLLWAGSSVGVDGAPLAPVRGSNPSPTGATGDVTPPQIPPPPPPPPLDAADIEFPGPMSAEWTVPAGARRLAGWAELPRDCWTWGHCVIVLSLAGADGSNSAELFRQTLVADTPIAEFNVELPATAPGRALRVTLEPGERGPIQDKAVLRRVLFACEPPRK